MSRFLSLLLILVLILPGCGEEPLRRPWTAAEAELLVLLEAQHEAEQAMSAEAPPLLDDGSTDWESLRAWRAALPEMLPEDEALLAFEEQHRGERVGLLALRAILGDAGGTLDIDHRAWRVRHAVLPSLPAYAADPLLPEVLRSTNSGGPDPITPQILAAVRDAEDATEGTRLAASLAIGRWCLEMVKRQEYWTSMLQDPTFGQQDRWSDKELREFFAILGPVGELTTLRSRAYDVLTEVASSPSRERPPAVLPVRDRWPDRNIVDVNPMAVPRATHAEEAAGLLLAYRSIKPGELMPPLTLELLDGSTWSSADRSGRPLLIHFGFRACGPCRALAPTLRVLHEKYGETLGLLAVKVDEDPADAAWAAESGEVSWPLHHDRGRRLATAWGIEGYPTVVLVGSDGRILDANLHGGTSLTEQVAQAVLSSPSTVGTAR